MIPVEVDRAEKFRCEIGSRAIACSVSGMCNVVLKYIVIVYTVVFFICVSFIFTSVEINLLNINLAILFLNNRLCSG